LETWEDWIRDAAEDVIEVLDLPAEPLVDPALFPALPLIAETFKR